MEGLFAWNLGITLVWEVPDSSSIAGHQHTGAPSTPQCTWGDAVPGKLIPTWEWIPEPHKDRTTRQSLHTNQCPWPGSPSLGQSGVGHKAQVIFLHHFYSFYVLPWPELHSLALSRWIIYNASGTESQQLLWE